MDTGIRRIGIALIATLGLALQPARGIAQEPASFTLEVQPPHPVEGSLVELVLTPLPAHAPAVAPFGLLAGEPLHFEPRAPVNWTPGGFRALGAVPLGAGDSIAVSLLLLRGGIAETARVMIPVARRPAGRERVRTAARFTPPPDSALRVRIAAERALARDAYRRAHVVPPLWTAPFLMPRDGESRVTSPFGAGRLVNGVWRSTHSGLDLAGARGAPVRAANRGVVALIGDFFYGGTSIYLHHGGGLVTIYHHLSRALVAVGDTVQRGQLIGHVGATGRVTGPHLHWGAHYGGVAFDPGDLLELPAGARR
ncbi:MAG: M23 family metallopeptidase [Gemmatimonadales bacterium]